MAKCKALTGLAVKELTVKSVYFCQLKTILLAAVSQWVYTSGPGGNRKFQLPISS